MGPSGIWSGGLSTVGLCATAPVVSALVSSNSVVAASFLKTPSLPVCAIKAAEPLLRTMVHACVGATAIASIAAATENIFTSCSLKLGARLRVSFRV